MPLLCLTYKGKMALISHSNRLRLGHSSYYLVPLIAAMHLAQLPQYPMANALKAIYGDIVEKVGWEIRWLNNI